ncbi:MAG TPA: Crp/Fnr family transcriptional regulator [Bacteroidales bacterium]|nr:Crp/Fnr family transcriptional regulator [Bacteroidales bacterium]
MVKYLNINLFKHLYKWEKKKIAENAIITEYDKGDLIVKRGSDNNRVLLLIEGYVKLYAEDQDYQRIIDILKPERIIGILSLFNRDVYEMSCEAITQVRILSFDKSILWKLLVSNHNFNRFWLTNLSVLINRYIQFFAFQNKKNVRGRIAEVLLYLSNFVYHSKYFYQTLTRKELAELANTSTETVIRILSEFRREKVIEINGKMVKILNDSYLQEMQKKG